MARRSPSIHILLGSQRWRRRRGVSRLGGAEVDVFGRPRFLYLTDTHRKRKAVLRSFEGRGGFSPDVRVFSAFLEQLWTDWGDGRPLVNAQRLGFLAEAVVADDAWLSGLGAAETTARALARLWIAAAEHPGVEVPEAARALGIHRNLGQVARDLPRWIQRARPWIESQPVLVIDDILQPSPARIRALLTLVKAWKNDVIISFACGEDAEAVLTGEDADPRFSATRALRRAVFEALVASGGADTWLALPDGPVPLLGSVGVRNDTKVRHVVMDSVADEVCWTLEQVSAALTADPDADLAIAVTDEARYGPVLERHAARRGLPLCRAAGQPLAATPVGRVLAALVRPDTLSPLGWKGLAADLGRDAGELPADQPAFSGPPSSWPFPTPLVALEVTGSLLERARALDVHALVRRSDRNERAWGAFLTAHAQLERDIAGTGANHPAALERLIATVRVPDPPGVQVIGMQELRGLTPDHLWVLGVDRTWPRRSEDTPLAAPEPVDRTAEALYLLGQIERNAVNATLSWPASIGTRENSASPWVPESERVQPAAPVPSPSPELPRGHLGHSLGRPARFGVTAAEVAVKCAARFWYQHVLELAPADPWDPELAPRRRGTAFHRILQRYYEQSDRTAAALDRIAAEVLDEIGREGVDPVLHAWATQRWRAGLVDERPRGLLAAWWHHEQERGIVPTAVEQRIQLDHGGIRFAGVLDRVEPGVVVDYKTGRPPTRGALEAGLALQPLVYLAASGADASAFQRVSRPDDVGYTGWFGDAGHFARGVVRTADERSEMLDTASEVLLGVLQGDVRTTVHGPTLAGCNSCPFSHVCRVEHP